MKKIFAVTVLVFGFAANAFAMDHRSQFGVGGSLGGAFAAPWASEVFRNQVSAKLPAAAAWVRYIPGTPEVGTELAYDYFGLGKQDINTHAITLAFISRQNPWGSFHPFYGIGIGFSKSYNWFTTGTWETPVYKLIAGIEFEMNERTDIGFHLNHFSIFKNKPTEQNLHALVPVLTITHYFGTPAPLPPAAPAAVTPTPAPVAAPAAPVNESLSSSAIAPEAPKKAKARPTAKPKAKPSQPAKKGKKAKKKAHSAPEATEGGN